MSEGIDHIKKAPYFWDYAVEWFYYTHFVTPEVKKTALYSTNLIIKRAIDNFNQSCEISYSTYTTNLNEQLVYYVGASIVASAIIGSILPGPGTVGGAILGAAVGVAFGITAIVLAGGTQFVLNHEIASRQITLAFSMTSVSTTNQKYLRALALHLGLATIKDKVLGQGLIQIVAGAFVTVIENEEQRWYDFMNNDFQPVRTENDACLTNSMSMLSLIETTDNSVGLLAYYPFNGNANDESGNRNNGSPINSPNYRIGRSTAAGSALQLNGTNQYVSLPSSINITNDVSISFWIKTNLSDANSWPWATFIIDRDLCYAQRDWSIGLGKEGKIQWNTGKNDTDYVLTSTSNVNDDNWEHIVVVRDTASRIKKIYINGQLNVSASFDNQSFANSSIKSYVGASVCETSTHHYYRGLIDDLRIYNRVLSEAQIQQLYKER